MGFTNVSVPSFPRYRRKLFGIPENPESSKTPKMDPGGKKERANRHGPREGTPPDLIDADTVYYAMPHRAKT